MAEGQGRGLLIVMMDVDAEHEGEFNRWYDEEHLPEQRAIPGFLTARRFRAVDGGPMYLALYELENPEAAMSDEYMNRTRSEWTQRIRKRFKNVVRRVYVEITPEE